MKNLLFFCFFVLAFQLDFAQQVRFRKVIGNTGYDYGQCAQQCKDHGYIVGGSTTSFGAGATDMYLIKTDSMGIPKIQNTLTVLLMKWLRIWILYKTRMVCFIMPQMFPFTGEEEMAG